MLRSPHAPYWLDSTGPSSSRWGWLGPSSRASDRTRLSPAPRSPEQARRRRSMTTGGEQGPSRVVWIPGLKTATYLLHTTVEPTSRRRRNIPDFSKELPYWWPRGPGAKGFTPGLGTRVCIWIVRHVPRAIPPRPYDRLIRAGVDRTSPRCVCLSLERSGHDRRFREDQWMAEIFQPLGVLTSTINSAIDDGTGLPFTSRWLVLVVVVHATSP